jgi:hypothetical protein
MVSDVLGGIQPYSTFFGVPSLADISVFFYPCLPGMFSQFFPMLENGIVYPRLR